MTKIGVVKLIIPVADWSEPIHPLEAMFAKTLLSLLESKFSSKLKKKERKVVSCLQRIKRAKIRCLSQQARARWSIFYVQQEHLFCSWPWYPSKAITNTMHMSINTNPLNIIPSDVHNLFVEMKLKSEKNISCHIWRWEVSCTRCAIFGPMPGSASSSFKELGMSPPYLSRQISATFFM